MFSEIHFPHIFIINDFIWSTVSQYRTIIYDVSAIAYTQRFPHVMVGDQHTDLTFPEKMDDFLYVQHGNRIHTCKRLIQKNKTWPRCQRTRNFYSTALAAGQADGRA